jgi:hypothetical protein
VITGFESQSGKWGVVRGVGALFPDRRKVQGDATPFHVHDDAQPQLGIGVTYPALSDDIFHILLLDPLLATPVDGV